MSPDVSFVLVAYNEEAHIEKTVRSVLSQEDLGEYEVVVVDDGSTDATAAIVNRLAAKNPHVRLVSHGHNRGRGAARATGTAAARGRVVAMGDGDVVFPSHWWSTCRDHLATFDAVGGTAVPDGDVSYVHQRARLVPRVRRARTVVPGSNGAFKADVLRSVSFDPALGEGEDIAINHALKEAGFRLLSIPGLTVEHKEDKDFVASVRWLFASGAGATRQLWRYRAVRVPDLAVAGWLFCLAAAVGQCRRPARSLALVTGYPALVATAHLAQRFEVDYTRPGRFALGVALDTVMLTAYFAGRVWGLGALVKAAVASGGGSAGPVAQSDPGPDARAT